MTVLSSLRRRTAYDAWANHRLAAALEDAHERSVRLLAHVAEAERTWLRRIRGRQPTSATADFWPAVDADGCRHLVETAATELMAFAHELDEARLADEAVYRNSTGQEYRTPVLDVLDHVLLHAQYHRGQANAALREAGAEPVPVDYIVWVRLGAPGAPGPRATGSGRT